MAWLIFEMNKTRIQIQSAVIKRVCFSPFISNKDVVSHKLPLQNLVPSRNPRFLWQPEREFHVCITSGRDVGGSFPECEKLTVTTFNIIGSRYLQRFLGALNILDLKFVKQIKLQYICKFIFMSAYISCNFETNVHINTTGVLTFPLILYVLSKQYSVVCKL